MMYIIGKILFHCIYMLCFFHILVSSRGAGLSNSGSHTPPEKQTVCWINVTSEDGTNFVQKPVICNTCCNDGCCLDIFKVVFGVVFVIIIIIVLCYYIYVYFKKKSSRKNIYKKDSLQMQSSGAESRSGVQNCDSKNDVNTEVEDLPSRLVDNAECKPSMGSH